MREKKERIDDLEYEGLKIIQRPDWFCFGIDSVILSEYATDIKPNSTVMDLGTGNGILSILLSKKIKAKKIIGIEIQKEVAEMAQRSIVLNKLEDLVTIENLDIRKLKEIQQASSVDAIVSNPPYKEKLTGNPNEETKRAIARHETNATLEDFIEVSQYLLKPYGQFYIVYRPERLVELIVLLRKYNIEPKKMRFVNSKIDKDPKLVVIKAIKGARPFLKVEKPLVIYDNNGDYTKEILEIYHKE